MAMSWRAALFPLLLVAVPVGAQERHATTARSTLVGGTANLSRGTTEGDDGAVWSYSLAPTHLYFLRDRIGVGGSVVLSRRTDERSEASFVGIGPAARYFLTAPGGRVLPFVGASALFGRGRLEAKEQPSRVVERTERTRLMEGVGGVVFMPTRQVGLAVELFHQRMVVRLPAFGDGSVTHLETGLRIGFAAFLIP